MLCEYDALPGIGHACGHNIIGTAGLGAGLAAAALADELGGRVVILGTPAEEGGGGKELLAQRGAFEGVDAAMMVHPAGADLALMNVIAIHQMKVRYHGEAAHAAAFPHKGRNALDAAVLGYMNVAALRQHIKPNERIHGIFTDGRRQAEHRAELRGGRVVRPIADADVAREAQAARRRVPRGGRAGRGLRDGDRVAGPRLRRHGRQPHDARPLRRERRPPPAAR